MVKTGIYIIWNKLNGHRYIGRSNDIDRRWNKHRSELRRGIHNNQHLQNAWDKHGESVFHFGIIELTDIDSIQEREQFWLSKHSVVGKLSGVKVYNLTEYANGVRREGEFTDDHKLHISESRASFSDAEIRDMRNKFDAGVPLIDITAEYGIDYRTMWKIVHRRSYRRVL